MARFYNLIQAFARDTQGTMTTDLMLVAPVVACLSLGTFGTVESLLSEKTAEIWSHVQVMSDVVGR